MDMRSTVVCSLTSGNGCTNNAANNGQYLCMLVIQWSSPFLLGRGKQKGSMSTSVDVQAACVFDRGYD